MGKTYKTLPDDLFFDDDFVSDDIDGFDFDDDMDSLLLEAPAKSKRQKHGRGRRKNVGHYTGSNAHRLPADWIDFDYSVGGSYDEWR